MFAPLSSSILTVFGCPSSAAISRASEQWAVCNEDCIECRGKDLYKTTAYIHVQVGSSHIACRVITLIQIWTTQKLSLQTIVDSLGYPSFNRASTTSAWPSWLAAWSGMAPLYTVKETTIHVQLQSKSKNNFKTLGINSFFICPFLSSYRKKNGLLVGSQIECYCYYSGFFESKDIYAVYTSLTPVNSQVHGSPIQCKECTHPISCTWRLNERFPDYCGLFHTKILHHTGWTCEWLTHTMPF